jgi:parallel beta-helix repeat protein
MNKAIYRLLRILGIILLTLSLSHNVYASGLSLPALEGQAYYVSPTGNDSAPGTQEQPWRTIQKAADSMPAGSIAIVLAGNYPERVRIQRPSLTFQAQGEVTSQGFVIQANYITIRGFTLTNWGQSYTTGNGVYVVNAGNCVIENNRFLYNTWGGVQLADTSHDCVVRNNVFFRNAMFAAEVMGSNHRIENNDVSHIIQRHPCSTSTAWWLDSDAFRFHGSGHVFKGNYVHDMPFGGEGYDQTACSIEALTNLENDYVSNSHMDCFQTYGGDHVAASNILFDGNRCDLPSANEWIGGAAKMFQGTQGTHDLTFVNNLGIVDFVGEFENASALSFVHNTFIGSDHSHSQGLQLYDSSGVYVHYNVFYNQANGIGHLWPVRSTVDEGNNAVYRTGGAPKRAAAPGDVWNINPMLDGNYHPLPGSPICLPNGEYMGAFPCSPAMTPTFVAMTETATPAPSSTPTTTIDMPTSIQTGDTVSAAVNLSGVPAEGYKSAEFTCTYDPNLVQINNIVVSGLFGTDAVTAIVAPQNGYFIVAIAGSNSQMATTSGAAFTFDLTGLQTGQVTVGCQTRVSRGDNLFTEIASIGAPLTILDLSFTPTPAFTPLPAPPMPVLVGQVLASKAVTVSLYNADRSVVATVTVNSDGIFSLTAPAGLYTVVATANGFLSAQGEAVLIEGETSIKLPISLIAGDIDGNNVIDQFDAMSIAMNYNTHLLEAADLNADGVIDVGDLEILSFHYRTAGALNWQ